MRVSALERPLELDEEAVAPECPRQTVAAPFGCLHAEAVARAAGEADETLGELGDELERTPTAAAAPGPRCPAGAFPHARR